jgi:DNA polymerase-3 subunit alpha
VGVDVKPPDVNLSDEDFSVVFDAGEVRTCSTGHVRFGLQAIKGISREAIRSIVAERHEHGAYASLHDFCERLDHAKTNQKACESLIRAGALDSVHGVNERAAMVSVLAEAYAAGKSLAADKSAGQNMLFGGGDDATDAAKALKVALPSVEPWNDLTRLAQEKDALGFHVSGHPLDQYEHQINEFCSATSVDVRSLPNGTPVVFAGVVTRVRPVHTRTGQRMAMTTLTDKFGAVDGVVFSEAYATHADLLQVEQIVILVGKVETGRGEPNIVVDRVLAIDDAGRYLATKLEIRFIEPRQDSDGLDPIRQRMQLAAGVLKQASGIASTARGRAVPTVVHLELANGGRAVLASRRFEVVPDDALLGQLKSVAGVDGLRVRGGYRPTIKGRPSRGQFTRAS